METFVAWLSRSRKARRSLTAGAVVLILVAVALIGYPAITNLVHDTKQGKLSRNLASPAERKAYELGQIGTGQALTRLTIPKIGVDVVVVQGVTTAALQAGAGHYPETPLPCTTGDVAIAGHRTTYGKPFSNVDRLGPGDTITLSTPIGSCVYRVTQNPYVVLPTDLTVVANSPGLATLTLTACTPKGSASHRIIIKAEMVSSELTV